MPRSPTTSIKPLAQKLSSFRNTRRNSSKQNLRLDSQVIKNMLIMLYGTIEYTGLNFIPTVT